MTDKFKPLTLKKFLKIPALKPFSKGYEPPTPHQIKSLRAIKGWTQIDVAKILGVSYNAKKGFSSTVSKWESSGSEYRAIPCASWRLLLLTPIVTKDRLNINQT